MISWRAMIVEAELLTFNEAIWLACVRVSNATNYSFRRWQKLPTTLFLLQTTGLRVHQESLSVKWTRKNGCVFSIERTWDIRFRQGIYR